jgi:A/G-specific adenine glycosylase
VRFFLWGRRKPAPAARIARVSAVKPPIAPALLAWHARAGRHDLPWQLERSPYRVWVSEIMLQQTQVTTVIAYYQRFMARFPDVASLAAAPIDEVLHLWSGLGYYARARNLHRAARCICEDLGGELPQSFTALAALPGIGRSTAGAILALARGERYPILDGNARRVLARYFGIGGAVGQTAVVRQLWQRAETETPAVATAAYTQAIMDLGAMVCVRRRPLCSQCPLSAHCYANLLGLQQQIPAPRRSLIRGCRQVFMVIALRSSGEVLLERRPDSGVWGGLWCLPEFTTSSAAGAFIRAALATDGCEPQALGEVEHAFTHFDLTITPLLVRCAPATHQVGEEMSLWYNIRTPARVGLPAPITSLLSDLARESLFTSAATLQEGS